MFKQEYRNWVEYRDLPGVLEYDFHRANDDINAPKPPYYELMDQVWDDTLKILKKAYDEGYQYVLFTHGGSTSRMGETTSRSQVRKLMRSKLATPYIIRKESIQHATVFVAALRKPKSI